MSMVFYDLPIFALGSEEEINETINVFILSPYFVMIFSLFSSHYLVFRFLVSCPYNVFVCQNAYYDVIFAKYFLVFMLFLVFLIVLKQQKK